MKYSMILNTHILGGLLSAMPDINTNDDRLYTIPGTPANLLKQGRRRCFCSKK